MLINGCEIDVRSISNIDIFNIQLDIPEPKPPLFTLDDGRVIENYHHPLYNHSIMLYASYKATEIFKNIIKRSVLDIDSKYLLNNEWRIMWENMCLIDHMKPEQEKFAFLLYHLFANDSDREKLIDTVVLTELRVSKFFNSISYVRQGLDIRDANIKNAVNTGIEQLPVIIGSLQIVNPLDEYKVASESGIPWNEWLHGSMSLDDKASAIALNRLDKLVHLHQEDAAQIEAERKSKK
ncbi:hypothetical protein KC678_02770 [Candidatus Dojkabacteria bacterium]|uniref:Uncharacterized protein n=1 Tax=Candidatus Dojkabacteria bacterium TaxID=2099670 RepID=A0A955IFB9_9BACT|nr:hypothetical protein [Candidatus Dojkabacteria bacterium]